MTMFCHQSDPSFLMRELRAARATAFGPGSLNAVNETDSNSWHVAALDLRAEQVAGAVRVHLIDRRSMRIRANDVPASHPDPSNNLSQP
jgi:hypothetical protein